MNRTSVVFMSGLLALGLSVGASSAESKPAAKKKAGRAATQTVQLDPAASRILWSGKKVTGAHNGTIQLKSGQVQLKGDQVTGGRFEVDMTSLANEDLTNPDYNAKLVDHLKSDDFFSVEKFPTASFKITGVQPLVSTDTAQGTHQVSGDLTIKGITKPVSFPATLKVEGGQAEGAATVIVDRTLYDVRYGSGKFFQNLGDKMIDDTFTLDLQLVGKVR